MTELQFDDEGGHQCGSDGCNHLSSCAVHNAPALSPGPCDCGEDAVNPAYAGNHFLALNVAVIVLIGGVIIYNWPWVQ